jgi:hypothetical protein
MDMKLLALIFAVLVANIAFAADKITVTIDELSNIDRGNSLEACGSAKHADGIKPLIVTLRHDQSTYNTIVGESGKWCVVFRRWNFNGKVEATATTLDFSDKSSAVAK